jgi:large conductance mechanosensitive channel
MSGFRNFVLRGNVVDLAIAVVIGAAFGTVVELPPATPTRECPECLSKIPVKARRCASCTAVVPV